MPRNITYPILYNVNSDDRNTYGSATLVSGQSGISINSSIVQVGTKFFVSRQSVGGTVGVLAAHPFTAGVSFHIDSVELNDTSIVNWMMLYDTSNSLPGLNVGLPWGRYPTNPVTWGKVTLVDGVGDVGCFYYSGNRQDVYLSVDTPVVSDFMSITTSGPGIFRIQSNYAFDSSVINWMVLRRTNAGLDNNARSGGLIILDSAPATATFGTATLVSGVATVNTSSILAGDNIMLSYEIITNSNNTGVLYARDSNINPGVSFIINSTNTNDNSTVNWWVLKSSDNP